MHVIDHKPNNQNETLYWFQRVLWALERYPCYPCEYKAKAKSNLKSHIESVHISKYSCNDCDKQYKSRTEVKQHIESVNHLKFKYPCNQCGK